VEVRNTGGQAGAAHRVLGTVTADVEDAPLGDAILERTQLLLAAAELSHGTNCALPPEPRLRWSGPNDAVQRALTRASSPCGAYASGDEAVADDDAANRAILDCKPQLARRHLRLRSPCVRRHQLAIIFPLVEHDELVVGWLSPVRRGDRVPALERADGNPLEAHLRVVRKRCHHPREVSGADALVEPFHMAVKQRHPRNLRHDASTASAVHMVFSASLGVAHSLPLHRLCGGHGLERGGGGGLAAGVGGAECDQRGADQEDAAGDECALEAGCERV
jgi:hypothetical protein